MSDHIFALKLSKYDYEAK